MRINKDKVQQLTSELEMAEKQLQNRTREFESLQVRGFCFVIGYNVKWCL